MREKLPALSKREVSFSSHVLWPEGAAVSTPDVTQDAAQHNGFSQSRSYAIEDRQKVPEEVNWFFF